MNELPEGAGDAELIARVRAGDRDAYGELYERHVGAAQACARAMVRNRTDADDLVNEAFTRVLNALRNAGGPEIAFRPYLLASVRNVAYDRARKNKRVDIVEDVDRVVPADMLRSEIDFGAGAERTIIADAYATLPERWRMVLWHTEVEGMSPADVAPLLGIAPNAVAALAYRAREGLRQAYLQAHVLHSEDADCRWAIERLSASARDRLPSRDRVVLDAHLEQCSDCRARYAEITHVNESLQLGLLPLVVGPTAASGYLKLLAAHNAHAAGAASVLRHAARRGKQVVRANSAATVGIAAAVVAAVAVVTALSLNGETTPQADRSATRSAAGTSAAAPKLAAPTSPPGSATPSADASTVAPSTSAAPASSARTVAKSAAPVTAPSTAAATSAAAPASTTSVPATSTTSAPATPTTIPSGTIDASVAMVLIGEQVTGRTGAFSVSIHNGGTAAASDVPVTISVGGASAIAGKVESGACAPAAPTMTCTIPSIAPGTTEDLLVTYVAPQVSVTAQAQATANGDVNSANNQQALDFTQAADGVSPTFVALDHGDFTRTGNSLLSCNAIVVGCSDARNRVGASLKNNTWTMANVDVDSDSATFNSSSAKLTIPSGDTVLWAGLYWGADTAAGNGGSAAPNAAQKGTVQLSGPSASQAVVADATLIDAIRVSRYQGYADVTAVVTAQGSGMYTVANVQAGTGQDRYAGWTLVVAYREPSAPLRTLYAFDGLRVAQNGAPVDVHISGFTYATGKRARLGVMVYEGDAGTTGDTFTVNGAGISDGLNPLNDVFNSTSSFLGIAEIDRSPADLNTFGFDSDVFDISGGLANGADQANLQFASTGDVYLVGSVTVAVDR
ncbi:MAG: sigma-70 family RNA polymerase sigma factor [Acidimicrobiia bacterium]